MTIPANTRVRILAFVGTEFEPRWIETGRVLRKRKGHSAAALGNDWETVKFDADGGVLCVHKDRLMVCNDQGM